MKTVKISAVRRIKTDELDLVVLELANGKPSVVRSPKEFLNDLKGSFLVGDNVTSMNHPSVRKVLRNLKGGILEGQLKYVTAGDKWKVTENSQVITNPKAKGFGQYAVGDMKEYEKDATIVEEGFLSLELNERAYEREENAEAYANARVTTLDAFDISSDIDSTSPVATNAEAFEDGNDEDVVPGRVSSATAEEAGA